MYRIRRTRISALFFLTLAAVAIACGTLLGLISKGDTFYVVPVALAFTGATVLIGCALADIRYARHLERLTEKDN